MTVPDPAPVAAALAHAKEAESAARDSAQQWTLLARAAGWSDYRIAEALGVTRRTVRRWCGHTS